MQELRHSRRGRQATRLDRDLLEGHAAIELVASGGAVRVHLQGFRYTDRIAPALAAAAQLAGVAFRLDRSESGMSGIVIGPRLPWEAAK